MRIHLRDEDRTAMCTGKQVFDSFDKANRVVRDMRRGRAFRGNPKPYRCPACREWHIGTPSNVR